jgi:hypothetical protein
MRHVLPGILVVLLILVVPRADARIAPGDGVWIHVPVPPWETSFGYATGVVESAPGERVRVRVRELQLPEGAPEAAAGGLVAGEVAVLPAARVAPFAKGRLRHERRQALVERLEDTLARLAVMAGEDGAQARVEQLAADLRAAGLDNGADQLELAWHFARLFRGAFAGHDPRAPPSAGQIQAVAGPQAFAALTTEIERLGLAPSVRRAINSVALEAPWVGRRLAERDGRLVAVIHAAPRRDHSRPAAIDGAGVHAAVLGLGRICQLLPFSHLSGVRGDRGEAVARIEAVLCRCFRWVTEDGGRLPPGVDLAEAVDLHLRAMRRVDAR